MSAPQVHGPVCAAWPRPEVATLEPDCSPNTILIEVVTSSGRAAAIELQVIDDTVEIWHHGQFAADFARTDLRAWLSDPNPRRLPMTANKAAFSIDRMVDHNGRVAISLPDVLVWTLDPKTHLRLTKII